MAATEEKKGLFTGTAVYKVNLHCLHCALDIKKPLMRTQGVHNVEFDIEKSEIKVKGEIDVIKIHKLIENCSKKRKVELLFPKLQKKNVAPEKKVVKEPVVQTTVMKVHMHCHKCESDLKKKLLNHTGIYSVNTDMNAQTATVQGIIEADKLVAYVRKKVHASAEMVTSRKDEDNKRAKPEADNKDKYVGFGDGSVVEFKEEGTSNSAPSFVHHTYAPQFFSDENPNACYIM